MSNVHRAIGDKCPIELMDSAEALKVGAVHGEMGASHCHAPPCSESKMDEFDKVMALVVLFGLGLVGFLAYGARRLDRLDAELRNRADPERRTETVGKSDN